MSNIFQTIRLWRRRNHTINVLRTLDDRALADIGLSRGAINLVVRNINR